MFFLVVVVCRQGLFLGMRGDFGDIREGLAHILVAPPGRTVFFHMPEHIGDIKLMLGHQATAGMHFFLGVGRIRINLLQACEVFIGFLQDRRCPVDGPELLHERHARLIDDVGGRFMPRMQRLEVLVRFRSQHIFLIKVIGVGQGQLRVDRIRAEGICIPQFVIQFNRAHIVLFAHGVIAGFEYLLRCILGRRQVDHIDDAAARQRKDGQSQSQRAKVVFKHGAVPGRRRLPAQQLHRHRRQL